MSDPQNPSDDRTRMAVVGYNYQPDFEAFTTRELQKLERRSFTFADEADYELAADLTMAVADLIAGLGHYNQTTLCVCPECHHEGTLGAFAFPEMEAGDE